MTRTQTHKKQFRSIILTVAIAIGVAGCQTTKPPEFTEVSLERTKLVLPEEFAKDVKARVRDYGSLRDEQLLFDGGIVMYRQYYHGGFKLRQNDGLIAFANRLFDGAVLGEPQIADLPIGEVRYLTLQIPGEDTCFVFNSHQGAFVQLTTGRGTEALLEGVYCRASSTSPSELRDGSLRALEKLTIRR